MPIKNKFRKKAGATRIRSGAGEAHFSLRGSMRARS